MSCTTCNRAAPAQSPEEGWLFSVLRIGNTLTLGQHHGLLWGQLRLWHIWNAQDIASKKHTVIVLLESYFSSLSRLLGILKETKSIGQLILICRSIVPFLLTCLCGQKMNCSPRKLRWFVFKVKPGYFSENSYDFTSLYYHVWPLVISIEWHFGLSHKRKLKLRCSLARIVSLCNLICSE